MKGQEKTIKVYVAMSGGVDSSVAAALLKKQGYNVTGVFFKPWLSPDGRAFCNWQGDRQDAMRVAAKLGIKFKVWDFSKEYGKKVTKYMINSYRLGITPNPDVMCNKEIKFGLFLKKALAEGADYIATGHYARLSTNDESVRINEYARRDQIRKFVNSKQIRYSLMTGVDRNKDQSYFLWTLTRKQLRYCLFPIGDYTKPEVRKLAKKFGLHTHTKKDSQGICFVGQLDVKEFLKQHIKPKEGEIKLLETDKTIGSHDGVYYYTIGQRHGLDIKTGGGPYFIVSKDIRKNIIYVSRNVRNLFASRLEVGNVSWTGKMPVSPFRAEVQVRYRNKPISATISKTKSTGVLLVKFKKPAHAVTPGQSAVFYRGEVVLGGGTII